MSKKIYLEPTWKLHSLHDSLISHPPDGYEFITSQTLDRKISKAASKISLSYFLEFNLVDKVLPLYLLKSYLERFSRIPSEAALTYSTNHLIFRKEPWVVDLEYVSILVGFDIKHFRRYKKIIENSLASDYCKKIICWSEAGRKTILLNLDASRLEKKIEVVPFAGQRRHFTKTYDNGKIKLLFINSGNIPLQFHYKGGKEVLQAFTILNSKYDNLELVVRSDLPKNLMSKYRGINNLRIIDKIIPWELLEQEFKSADIFLYPTHSSQDVVVLDAMSYELAVVITDVFANPEIIEDGRTGFVIKKSEKVPYYVENLIPASGAPQFEKAIRLTDPRVVEELVEKTSILIENKELRRQMGKGGRWEVEHGKFSIPERNEKLKRIFDEATAAPLSHTGVDKKAYSDI